VGLRLIIQFCSMTSINSHKTDFATEAEETNSHCGTVEFLYKVSLAPF